MTTLTRYERLRGEFLTHVKAARAIIDRAERDGRALTATEEAEGLRYAEQAKATKVAMDQAKTDEQMTAGIRDLGSGLGLLDGGTGTSRNPRVKALGGSAWGSKIVESQSDHGGHFKALLPAGVVPVTVPLAPEPVRIGEPVLALRQLIPTVADPGGRWAYWRQVGRQNGAAVVVPGAVKPSSDFPLERVDNRARTLAHIATPVQRQDIDDAPLLAVFVEAELRLGLELALENEIVNGDGAGEHFTGLLSVSGSVSQPFATDRLTTTRRAITSLEVQNLTPSGFVFHPADWQEIELAANDHGYTLAQAGQAVPVDRAARRLWGVPVVLSTTLPVGTGVLADFATSTQLKIREEARVDWSENTYDPNALGAGQGASDFTRNLMRWRCEMRAGLDIMRPAGIVELDLTA